MDLKTSNSLSTNKVRSNDELVEGLHTSSFEHDELLNSILVSVGGLVVTFRVASLDLPHALFDLL